MGQLHESTLGPGSHQFRAAGGWTFSYLAYLVHFYYAVIVTFGGSVGRVYADQGPLIATTNFLLTLWWGLDVLLAWIQKSEPRWARIQRVAAHVYVGVMFVIATLALKAGIIRYLGILMTTAVLSCLAVRGWRRLSHA
jgi:hypothetical protein